jgi:hypothetical protein
MAMSTMPAAPGGATAVILSSLLTVKVAGVPPKMTPLRC